MMREPFPAVLSLSLSCALLASAATPVRAADGPAVYEGVPVNVGRGTARTVVRAVGGEVTEVAIVLSATALEGLPPGKKRGGHTAYLLPMPKQGPRTVIDHVGIDWEAAGHPPPKVYDVPHFDFHFYLIPADRRMKIAFAGAQDSGDPKQQPPADLLAAGYVVPPGTAVPKMGVHAVHPGGAEFQGQPFTATFIYGFHDREMIFLEPMATLAFLKSKPDFSAPIPRPARYSIPGRYPSAYAIRFDTAKARYEIALGDWR